MTDHVHHWEIYVGPFAMLPHSNHHYGNLARSWSLMKCRPSDPRQRCPETREMILFGEPVRPYKLCTEQPCDQPVNAHGLCRGHERKRLANISAGGTP